MSRKALSIIVGVLGFVIAGTLLVGMMVMGSLFADARTENITGAGVDVFLRTPFPREGDTVILDVEARGGSRAGVETISARDGRTKLVEVSGGGASWGYSIRSGKSRGSETVEVRFIVPAARVEGQTLPLELHVAYVCAMSSGGSFENERHNDVVRLDIPIHSASSKRIAQLKQVGAALGLLVIWILVVWGIAKLYALADAREPHVGASETEAIGLVMGVMGGGLIGYWMFALRILDAVAIQSTLLVIVLTLVWIALPLVIAWQWSKRQPVAPPKVTTSAAELRAISVSHDAALSSVMLLEMSKVRLGSLVAKVPELAAIVTWIDEVLPSAVTSKDPALRRRVVALNWCLANASPVLLREPIVSPSRDDLIQAICAVAEIASDEDRERISERVQSALAVLR